MVAVICPTLTLGRSSVVLEQDDSCFSFDGGYNHYSVRHRLRRQSLSTATAISVSPALNNRDNAVGVSLGLSMAVVALAILGFLAFKEHMGRTSPLSCMQREAF